MTTNTLPHMAARVEAEDEHELECYRCGEDLPLNEAIVDSQGDEFCDNCVAVCVNCRTAVSVDDLRPLAHSNSEVCTACVRPVNGRSSMYQYSGYDHAWVHVVDAVYVNDVGVMHVYTAQENFYYWDSDGEYHEEPEPERVIQPYSADILDVFALRPEYTRRSLIFGVEVEVEGDDQLEVDEAASFVSDACCPNREFILKEDGSLDYGFEVVTMPYTLKHHQDKFGWSGVFKDAGPYVRSGRSDTNCGMHVHINRNALSPLVIGKMLVFVNSDKTDDFIRQVAQRDSARWAQKMDKKISDGSGGHTGKYERLNVCDYRPTVEIRIFKGNMRADRILKNIEFCHALVMYCRQCSIRDADNSAKFKYFVSENRKDYPNLYNFLKERRAI